MIVQWILVGSDRPIAMMQHPCRCSSSGRRWRFLDGANLGHITYRVRRKLEETIAIVEETRWSWRILLVRQSPFVIFIPIVFLLLIYMLSYWYLLNTEQSDVPEPVRIAKLLRNRLVLFSPSVSFSSLHILVHDSVWNQEKWYLSSFYSFNETILLFSVSNHTCEHKNK